MADDYDKNVDKPNTKERLLDWAYGLVEDGRDRRTAHEALWWENIATFCGDFWVKYDVHRRILHEPPKKDRSRVRIPVNLAQPVVRTELAKLTKNKPITDVMANSNEKSDINAAEVGGKILDPYAERKFHLPKVRRRMLHWVLMCGYGGIFVDWDGTREEGGFDVVQDSNGNPIFDERVVAKIKDYYAKKNQQAPTTTIPMGELVVRAVSPFQILFDMSRLYIEDAWWCIFSDVDDVIEIERRWGEKVQPDDSAKPGVIEQRMLGRFDLTGKLSLDAPKAQSLAEIHRLFVKPGHPLFPEGAHIVFTRDKLLLHEVYPFAHGELPISAMGHIPLPTSQYSMSVIQQVRPLVLELSRTFSQLIENRNLMANPAWVVPKQLRIPKDEIQNKPGLRLEYQAMPNLPPPQPVQMPEMPTYVKDLIPNSREIILDISGQGETSQGRVPAGARSGVAIAYLQEEDDTRLGPTVQEFEETHERVSEQILEVIAEKYDLPRTIRIPGKHREPEVFDFVGTMLEGNTTVVCQAGSGLPRSKAAKQQYILDLYDRKIEQDPRKVRQMLELGEGEPDEFEKDLDQAERENRRMLEGQEVDVEEWYNHPAHHLVHRDFMKSADFEDLDPEQQQIFKTHDMRHTEFERQQQMDQMVAQGGQSPNGNGGPPGGGGPQGVPPQQNPPGNGQNVPEGPQGPYSSGLTPRTLLESGPS